MTAVERSARHPRFQAEADMGVVKLMELASRMDKVGVAVTG
jgi:hypothetical protein